MPQLSEEDMKRVQVYLAQSQHQVERKPFSFWRMASALSAVLVLLTLLSMWISSQAALA